MNELNWTIDLFKKDTNRFNQFICREETFIDRYKVFCRTCPAFWPVQVVRGSKINVKNNLTKA